MKLLGLDVGTSGTRAVVIDEHGAIIASHTAGHQPFASPQTGWAEQDARDWWRATIKAVRGVLNCVPADDIAALSLSGQMHGATLLDEKNEPLRPAIIWCDGRTTKQCETITSRIGRERLIELVLNPALEGFTLPKMLWVRDTEPETWNRTRRVLLPKDYVRLKLTNEAATDVADASGTLLLDVQNRKWSSEMFAAFDIDERLMPRVYESTEVTGAITDEAARLTGLITGTPVIAGAGDQAAGAVGLGIVKAGAVSATIGTSGVVFAATEKAAIDAKGRVHTFCHAVPERWHVMGVTQAAGLSLSWFKETFGISSVEKTNGDKRDRSYSARDCTPDETTQLDAYELLCREAADVEAGANGLLWTPYLMGERTPHLDAKARAALIGLTAQHTRAHIVRAILEGVAFSLKDTLTIFDEMRVPVETIKLGGGGARSCVWRKIQTDIYAYPTQRAAAEEGAAYGAAMLAGVAVSCWASVDAACEQVVKTVERLEPDAREAAVMSRRYAQYQKIYQVLKEIEY